MNSIYTSSGDTDGHTFDKKAFAEDIRRRLASHRDTFVVDEDDWLLVDEESASAALEFDAQTKLVSAASLKLLLDYCESEWPNMTIVQYAAAVFWSREPGPGESLFSLLPDVQQRLTADRLGLGHIYK